MKKIIVTTTINFPTEAMKKYVAMKDWKVIVVGDIKTPHDEYKKLECIYLSPEYQEEHYKEISDVIGWKTIQRRNIGFIEAYKRGADIVATVDDDNIPYDNWGKEILIGKKVEVDCWDSQLDVIDPLQATNNKQLWHRGYPIHLIKHRHNIEYVGKKTIVPLVQANLWDGDPDIDSILRLSESPIVKFDNIKPYCFNKLSPFNSQNTFLSRTVIPYYTVLPFVGRMDDIWGGYLIQSIFKDSIVYAEATVYQKRNEQDLVKNLENEILGYRFTKEFVKELRLETDYIPEKTRLFYKLYRSYFV